MLTLTKPEVKTYPRGKPGNPGGRPKGLQNIKALARSHTERAIDALVLALRDRSTRVPAAVALLDRGYVAEDIKKLLGGNLLRVFGQVEQISREMQASQAVK